MKQFIIHSLTFMAIVLPVLYFLVLDDRTEKKKSGDASLPLLFRLLNPMADFMETLGIGNFFRNLTFHIRCTGSDTGRINECKRTVITNLLNQRTGILKIIVGFAGIADD